MKYRHRGNTYKRLQKALLIREDGKSAFVSAIVCPAITLQDAVLVREDGKEGIYDIFVERAERLQEAFLVREDGKINAVVGESNGAPLQKALLIGDDGKEQYAKFKKYAMKL